MNKEYKPITNLWKDSEGYRYFGTLKLSSKIKYDGDDFIPLWEWINQLQQENKKQKEVIDKAINDIDLVIELIKQQPTEDDTWILNRLNGFKIILEDKEV